MYLSKIQCMELSEKHRISLVGRDLHVILSLTLGCIQDYLKIKPGIWERCPNTA